MSPSATAVERISIVLQEHGESIVRLDERQTSQGKTLDQIGSDVKLVRNGIVLLLLWIVGNTVLVYLSKAGIR